MCPMDTFSSLDLFTMQVDDELEYKLGTGKIQQYWMALKTLWKMDHLLSEEPNHLSLVWKAACGSLSKQCKL